jgi:hypothetical protein
MNTTKMETEDVIDDIILDVTTEDLFQEVGDPVRDSTPSAPSAPQPFQFLNDSVLQPQVPILPEILSQPQSSQTELAALRTAWAGMDSIRLDTDTQGALLADVTSGCTLLNKKFRV